MNKIFNQEQINKLSNVSRGVVRISVQRAEHSVKNYSKSFEIVLQNLYKTRTKFLNAFQNFPKFLEDLRKFY